MAKTYYELVAQGLLPEWQSDEAENPEYLRALLGLGRILWINGDSETAEKVTMFVNLHAEEFSNVTLMIEASLQLTRVKVANAEWIAAMEQCHKSLELACITGDCFMVYNISRLLSQYYVRKGRPKDADRVLANADNYLSLWHCSGAVFGRPWWDLSGE